ncbi:integrator complex subunit 9-like protein [Dinothrombium tinctorium]|uniref:Integrator complex subunit 9-like protein n=1 Tax=Dinothrombium tinctorium TaxID=1965070 RepID=A0A3S3PP55_9ACAR|nr:integrator complex subunit 9-like protein [Dinothrombium tinctorium]RWS13135.1 integrator complex subunit 9-like protein [Dinothrombium tinctorium]RWS13690.1 integrator complex subunit 9-like protein [Dinothrombium tinctorium]
MKFIALNENPCKPCNIIKVKDTIIMVDCALDLLSSLCFLPLRIVSTNNSSHYSNWTTKDNQELETELKECGSRVFVDSSPEFSTPEYSTINFEHIDVILISNYNCLLALPFITERTNFQGVVYCTEPTLLIGRQFMEEMITNIERCPKTKEAFRWKQNYKQIPFPVNVETLKPHLWKQIYSLKELNNSLSKVKIVAFSEKIDVFGNLQVTPLSSGYCIGSCNWVINTNNDKIVYLSATSTLTTHPKPMDHGPLRNASILILTNLTQTPTSNPDNMLGALCENVSVTLKNGGNVLIPCYSSGIIYDLFECFINYLESNGHSSVPLFFISPVADQSLAYSNILAEWLTQNKQSKVYLPEEPFPHAAMVRLGRLKHYPGIHVEAFSNDYKTPCIVFTGHPSLRFGDVVHFIELWGQSPNNLIVFTEPDFPYLEALTPFQPLMMKVAYCPIDTSLNFSQANKLLRDLKPSRLIIPHQYVSPPMMQKHRTDLVIDYAECETHVYKRNETIKIPLKRNFEKISISSELANSLVPSEIRPGLSIATITGLLVAKDNKYELKPLKKNEIQEAIGSKPGLSLPPLSYTWGTLDLQVLMQKLINIGIYDTTIEQTSNGCIVHLRSEEAFVTIDDVSTHIVCDASSNLRTMLKDIVVECLKKF